MVSAANDDSRDRTEPFEVAPFGSWDSAFSAERVASAGVRLGQLAIDGDALVWGESRPAEEGRQALVRASADGRRHDLTAAPWSARSRVHEYGGGAFTGSAAAFEWSSQTAIRRCRTGSATASA